MAEKSGFEMLAEWLEKGLERSVMEIDRWPLIGWRCRIYDGVDKFKGFGPTPDAAIRDAVEKARKSDVGI